MDYEVSLKILLSEVFGLLTCVKMDFKKQRMSYEKPLLNHEEVVVVVLAEIFQRVVSKLFQIIFRDSLFLCFFFHFYGYL